MPHNPTFNDLCNRYGEIMALAFVSEIEKAAHIAPRHNVVDPQARLTYAYRVQDLEMMAQTQRLAA